MKFCQFIAFKPPATSGPFVHVVADKVTAVSESWDGARHCARIHLMGGREPPRGGVP